jgi:SPW repeat
MAGNGPRELSAPAPRIAVPGPSETVNGDIMLDGNWRSKEVFDLCKLACAAALFATPWLLDLGGRPAWNLWVCGYAMVTIALADLTAEADWEARTSFYLGAWLLAAPWLLGVPQDVAATLVHIVGGGIISLLSVAELWSSKHTPPRRFVTFSPDERRST